MRMQIMLGNCPVRELGLGLGIWSSFVGRMNLAPQQEKEIVANAGDSGMLWKERKLEEALMTQQSIDY